MRRYVKLLQEEAIWKLYNEREVKAVPGISTHAPMLQEEAIWRYCNGREVKAVPGIRTHVIMLLVVAV